MAMRRSERTALKKIRRIARARDATRIRETVTLTRTDKTGSKQYCREYQQKITVGENTERAHGRACRQPDGQWRIVESRDIPAGSRVLPSTTRAGSVEC